MGSDVVTQLQQEFDRELSSGDRWAAAETAFALAVTSRDSGLGADRIRYWLDTLLGLLADFPTDRLEQTATRRTKVGDVPLPEHLHDGVVVSRFEGLLRTV